MIRLRLWWHERHLARLPKYSDEWMARWRITVPLRDRRKRSALDVIAAVERQRRFDEAAHADWGQ